MKRKELSLFILLFLTNLAFSQDTIRLVPGYTTIQYLQKTPGGKSNDVRDIHLKLIYWKGPQKDSLRKDAMINFTIIDYGTKLKTENLTDDYIVAKDKITSKHDTIDIVFHFMINSITDMSMPEFFDVKLNGPVKEVHRVVLQKDTLPYKLVFTKNNTKKVKYQDSGSITYLNGINFDFDKKTDASYVGLFNVFCPELKSWPDSSKNENLRYGWGFNTGLMKTNFAKAGDSINDTNYLTDTVLINPLDTVKAGKKYLRQYNRTDGVSKNTTFSFFGQPMTGVYLKNKFYFLVHGHVEFLVNKWVTTTTTTNLQQDTGKFTGLESNKPKEINKFKKSVSDPVTSSSSMTTLSLYAGGGVTCVMSPWKGSSVFVQYTSGYVTSYQPKSLNKKSVNANDEDQKYGFFLTRASIKQQLSNNVDVVLGTEFRGTYSLESLKSNGVVYVCYLGIIIDVNALKDLLK